MTAPASPASTASATSAAAFSVLLDGSNMSFLELALRVREHERDGFADRVSGIGEARLQQRRYAHSGHCSHDLRICTLTVLE